MFRFITPIILFGVSVAAFFFYINPTYKEIKVLQAQQASYDQALNNSRQLQSVRDVLVGKYNTFAAEDIKKLKKMLPDAVDNIRLIIDIDGIASKYGMKLTNVKYDTSTKTASASGVPQPIQGSGTDLLAQTKPYGSFDLEFSTKGSYANFTSFVKDLEKSLRIVDVNSVSFSSTEGDISTGSTGASAPYKYDFKIKTYWLKS